MGFQAGVGIYCWEIDSANQYSKRQLATLHPGKSQKAAQTKAAQTWGLVERKRDELAIESKILGIFKMGASMF